MGRKLARVLDPHAQIRRRPHKRAGSPPQTRRGKIKASSCNQVAEREGFEPSVHLLGVHTISSRAPSASRTSLRKKSLFSKYQASVQCLRRTKLFSAHSSLLTVFFWRRGWDSNPRALLFTGQLDFESSPVRPLRYLSAGSIFPPQHQMETLILIQSALN